MFRNSLRLSKRKSEANTEVDADVDVDKAWETENFALVLRYLIKDSNFPKDFDSEVLSRKGSSQDAVKLLAFCAKRAEIHRSVRVGDLKKLKKLVSKRNSKFYLNKENESAVFTAVKYKKFEIYAFLKSIGAKFKDQTEHAAYSNLDTSEKTIVESHFVRFYPRISRTPVSYLISKTRSSREERGQDEDFEEKTKSYYEKLNQIKEISEILQVIQNADYLDIIFDFDNDNISHLSHTSSDSTRGLCNYKVGRLYIAAGSNRKQEEILGTVAHEITHFALELMYENECNPYKKYDEIRKSKFQDVVKKIKEKMEKMEKMNSKYSLTGILSETFSAYEKSDYESELIVRVPQIMAQNDCGKDWLKTEASDLYAFYLDVLKDCRHFVKNESCKLPVRKQIRLINNGIGELQKMKRFPLSFKDVSEMGKVVGRKRGANILKRKKPKNISVVAGESSWLCLLKALQGFYNDHDYVNCSDRYLVLKFQNFKKEKLEILRLFLLGSDLLIIENSDEVTLSRKEFDELEDLLMGLFNHNKKKRVIFAVDNNTEPKIKEILKYLEYDYFKDSNLSFRDLDGSSQETILSKILFQKKQLIEDKDSIELDAKAIDEIIRNEIIQIGTNTFNFYQMKDFFTYEKIVLRELQLIGSEDVVILVDVKEKFENHSSKLAHIIYVASEEEAQKKFDEYKNLHQIIYWLEIKDDKIVYKNSQGSLDKLRPAIDTANSKICAVTDASFIQMLKHEKAIIISVDPATTRSSENRSLYKNYWIVQVDLKDFVHKSKNLDFEDMLDYLAELHEKSIKNAIKSLLKDAIIKGLAVPLLIVFDGFDEKLEEPGRTRITSLLKILKDETKAQILIITHADCKNLLENTLSTFALEFQH